MRTESLKLLTAKSPSLESQSPSHGDFDWRNVAGALGRCSKMAREFAYLKYQLAPEPGHPRLEAFIGAFRMREVLPLFERENWKSGPISIISRLVVEDAMFPWTCKSCQGVGERVLGGRIVSCEGCTGTGVKRLTGRERAEKMGIEERTYHRVWRERYQAVAAVVAGYEAEIASALGRG